MVMEGGSICPSVSLCLSPSLFLFPFFIGKRWIEGRCSYHSVDLENRRERRRAGREDD